MFSFVVVAVISLLVDFVLTPRIFWYLGWYLFSICVIIFLILAIPVLSPHSGKFWRPYPQYY